MSHKKQKQTTNTIKKIETTTKNDNNHNRYGKVSYSQQLIIL